MTLFLFWGGPLGGQWRDVPGQRGIVEHVSYEHGGPISLPHAQEPLPTMQSLHTHTTHYKLQTLLRHELCEPRQFYLTDTVDVAKMPQAELDTIYRTIGRGPP